MGHSELDGGVIERGKRQRVAGIEHTKSPMHNFNPIVQHASQTKQNLNVNDGEPRRRTREKTSLIGRLNERRLAVKVLQPRPLLPIPFAKHANH
jgi:hypothetical protein